MARVLFLVTASLACRIFFSWCSVSARASPPGRALVLRLAQDEKTVTATLRSGRIVDGLFATVMFYSQIARARTGNEVPPSIAGGTAKKRKFLPSI